MKNSTLFPIAQTVQQTCLTLCQASLVAISLAAPAIAAHTLTHPINKVYTPPKDVRPLRGPAIPGGARPAQETVLTVIAPQQQSGQTSSTQPTLTWFVNAQTPYDMTIQFYEYTDNSWHKLDERSLGESQQGYNSYTVPASYGLTAGGFYRWHITLQTRTEDSITPNNNTQISGAHFEVVSAAANFKPLQLVAEQPIVAESLEAQAQQYAAAGLWYDAIALLLSPDISPEAQAYRTELLLSLADLENNELNNLGERLQAIAHQE